MCCRLFYPTVYTPLGYSCEVSIICPLLVHKIVAPLNFHFANCLFRHEARVALRRSTMVISIMV